jgi:hypothetical protein
VTRPANLVRRNSHEATCDLGFPEDSGSVDLNLFEQFRPRMEAVRLKAQQDYAEAHEALSNRPSHSSRVWFIANARADGRAHLHASPLTHATSFTTPSKFRPPANTGLREGANPVGDATSFRERSAAVKCSNALAVAAVRINHPTLVVKREP